MKASYYTGYSLSQNDRYNASSGGVGTCIVKHLLSSGFDCGISFEFDKDKCRYIPKLIHSSSEYNVCGSIYHDIDIVGFLKDNITSIKNSIVVTCMPCQIKAVRRILADNHKRGFIISFSCSGQMTIEGTWKYLNLLGVNKKDVNHIRYRGKGWPGGITVETKDGQRKFYPNYSEPWTLLHQSRLYSPSRCLFCKYDSGRDADISIADPWIPEYLYKDNIGTSLVSVFTEDGLQTINSMVCDNELHLEETIYQVYERAQKNNLNKRHYVEQSLDFLKFLSKLILNHRYHTIASKNIYTIKVHLVFISFLEKFFRLKK